MARATALAIEPLLDAADVGRACACSTSAAGSGTLAAAAAARGARRHRRRSRRGHARRGAPAPPGDRRSSQADAEDLPFADGAFDVALGAFLVNHLPHPERAAAELARVARRVALAMWGPEDEVAFLGLPARAAADLDANVPPRPGLAALHRRRRARRAARRRHRHRARDDAARRLARRALGRHPRRHRPHRRPPRRRHPSNSPPPAPPHHARRAVPRRRPATTCRSRSASPEPKGAWPLYLARVVLDQLP